LALDEHPEEVTNVRVVIYDQDASHRPTAYQLSISSRIQQTL